MASGFDDVSLEWAGKTYVIKSTRRLQAIARIEEHITLAELQRYWQRQTAPLARLAAAFGSVLRYAGATDVSDEDIYSAMFPGGKDQPENVQNAVTVLISMMIPPAAFPKEKQNGSGEQPEKKVMPAPPAGLSRKRSKSPSAIGK